MSPDFELDAMAQAAQLQQQMMEQMYGNNPEMLAMLQQQMAAAQAMQGDMLQQQMSAVQEISQAAAADPLGFMQGLLSEMGEEMPEPMSIEAALTAVDELEEQSPVTAPRDSDAAKAFAILLSGVVSNLNGHELDQLDVEAREPFFRDKISGILENGWGISDREDLMDTLTYLTQGGGHTARYAAYCAAPSYEACLTSDMDADDRSAAAYGWEFAQKRKGTHSPQALLGWDYGRAAMVARWGYFLDLMTEEECRSFLASCADAVTKAFSSWREFGRSYLFGGCFWSSLRGGEEAALEYCGDILPALGELLDPVEGDWYQNRWVKELA